MPVGTGATLLTNIPPEPFVQDPDQFAATTTKNLFTSRVVAMGNMGAKQPPVQLPQTGIISKVRLVFDGTMTVAAAAPTTNPSFPYNLVNSIQLNAGGQTGLWDCAGPDLQALRLLRYPSYVDQVDQVPALGVGAHPVHLTWELPIAMDEQTLVGSLFAQSSSTNLTLSWSTAALADLFATNPANVTFAGSWYVQVLTFEIPFDSTGRLVLPDLSKNHGFNAFEMPVVSTGDTQVPLIRSAGSLVRVLQRITNGTFAAGAELSPYYVAGASPTITRMRLQYGGNQTPFDWQPATLLASEMNENYGDILPNNYMVLDFIRQFPARDVVLMQGVTNLYVIPTIAGTVAINAGATVHTVQETLF